MAFQHKPGADMGVFLKKSTFVASPTTQNPIPRSVAQKRAARNGVLGTCFLEEERYTLTKRKD